MHPYNDYVFPKHKNLLSLKYKFIIWVLNSIHVAARFFLRKKIKNKFAFCSKFVPPASSGQAVVIGRFLENLSIDEYCLIQCVPNSQIVLYQKEVAGESYKFRQERIAHLALLPTRKGQLALLYCIVVRAIRIAIAARKSRVATLIGCSGDMIDPVATMLASRLVGADFIMYFFDDFTLQWWGDLQMVRTAHFLERFICPVARKIIVPSEQMWDIISLRYGRESALVRNPAPTILPQVIDIPWPAKSGELSVIFTGAVYHLNIAALNAVAESLDIVYEKTKLDGILCIYTAQDHEALRSGGLLHPRIAFFDHVQPDEVLFFQQNSDILLLPFNVDENARLFINSSATAKLADYLLAGRPILAICPDNSFLSLFFEKHNCGISVYSESPKLIAEKIITICTDKDLRDKQRSSTLRLATTEFSAIKAQNDLLASIREPQVERQHTRRPNILHVSGFDVSGAQANGYLLHQYCKEHGLSTYMAVGNKLSDDPEVINLGDFLSNCINNLFQKYENRSGTYGFQCFPAWKLIFLKEYREANIVHLHLPHVIPFFSLYLLKWISRKKKVVFSIHDMFMMTGHCTYALECQSWKFGCHNCQHLCRCFGRGLNTASKVWSEKFIITHKAKMHLVAGSPLLLEEIKQSPILRDSPVTYIPYGTDTDIFYDRNKQYCRKKYEIPQDCFVIFFRASPRPEDIKGYYYIIDALRLLKGKKQVFCITTEQFTAANDLKDVCPVLEVGWIFSQVMLAELLSASDILLMPSIGEGFGLLATESMACGTPVIVFEGTALPITIDAPNCGIAIPRSAVSLAEAIDKLINDPVGRHEMSKRAVSHVKENHSFEAYAAAHVNLYERLANE